MASAVVSQTVPVFQSIDAFNCHLGASFCYIHPRYNGHRPRKLMLRAYVPFQYEDPQKHPKNKDTPKI
eukprot:5641548-Amphidinium_carterae.1